MNRYRFPAIPGANARNQTRLRAVLVALVAMAVAAACLLAFGFGMHATRALAQETAARPNVLVIDAGLGDRDFASNRWLGEDIVPIAQDDGFELDTANDPAWWAESQAEGPAPKTYFLSNPDGASTFKPTTLVWALDRIRDTGADSKTVVVATAAVGLPVREYLEGRTLERIAERNDVAGVVFCGTPHGGYSATGRYPELGLWNDIARTIGASVDDLKPASAYLGSFDAASLPAGMQILNLTGVIGDLGFGLTDGAGVAADFALDGAPAASVTTRQVRASVAQSVNLTGMWMPYANRINYATRLVDAQVAERASGQPSYLSSSDVAYQVGRFYETCAEGDAAEPGNMTVMALDLSGSMLDRVDDAGNKLEAAKSAAKEYLESLESRSSLPTVAPTAITVLGFNVETSKIAESFDQAARNAIDRTQAVGETDIGAVLDEAVSELRAAPDGAAKRILLLSDGASTLGKSEADIFATSIAEARDKGIVIDTIGFGDIGESDAGFLRRVSSETGGTSYYATDTATLKKDFFMSYQASLNQRATDQDAATARPQADFSGPLLLITALLLVALVALTFALTFRRAASTASTVVARRHDAPPPPASSAPPDAPTLF